MAVTSAKQSDELGYVNACVYVCESVRKGVCVSACVYVCKSVRKGVCVYLPASMCVRV